MSNKDKLAGIDMILLVNSLLIFSSYESALGFSNNAFR